MTFLQFALNNVKRNRRAYSAYFLSSSFSVMIFFSFAMFIFHPEVTNGYMYKLAKNGMMVSEFIIFFFSFFFIFYSISTFLKIRNKEFGILMIHGMSKRQLNLLIFTENMIIGFCSILLGIGVGLVFSKLFFMISGYTMEISSLPMYFPLKAIGLTILSFLFLFFIVSLSTSWFIKSSKVISLLSGSQKPKPEPKASIILSLLAALTIGIGYTLSFAATIRTVSAVFLPVTILVIIGTYFIFSQLSVFILRLLKRNQSFYFKKTNMITLSSLIYRMKDNARMFFGVTIISTVAFCAVGTFVSFTGTKKEELIKYMPFAFQLTEFKAGQFQDKFEKKLKEEDVAFSNVQTKIKVKNLTGIEKKAGFIPQSNYNKIAKKLGYETVRVQGKESVVLPNWGLEADLKQNQKKRSIQLADNKEVFTVNKMLKNSIFTDYSSFPYYLYVVSNSEYNKMNKSVMNTVTSYSIKNWEKTSKIETKPFNKKGTVNLVSRAERYHLIKQVYGIMLFLSLFVGVIFYLSSVSFLYFRLYSDLEGDKKFYEAISKIGLTDQEIKKISSLQIGLLFFVPFVVATIHTSVAYTALQELINTSILLPASIVIACFFIVHFLYFLAVRTRYLANLK